MEDTNWKQILENNRDEIEEKMVELYREWEGNNQDVHEGLGITRQGELFTWTYVGNYSEPESTWNGTDLCIATFSAWDWTDSNGDWKNIALSCAEDGAEKEKLMQRFEEEEELSELELLRKEFPDLYEYIKDTEIDAEMDSYRENVSEMLDEIMRNID